MDMEDDSIAQTSQELHLSEPIDFPLPICASLSHITFMPLSLSRSSENTDANLYSLLSLVFQSLSLWIIHKYLFFLVVKSRFLMVGMCLGLACCS